MGRRPEAAVTVDHIVPKSMGGTDNDENYQSLSDECHKEKTARDRQGWTAWHIERWGPWEDQIRLRRRRRRRGGMGVSISR